MESNLFAQLEQAAGSAPELRPWTIQAPFDVHSDFDILLIPQLSSWQERPQARESLARIETEDAVANAVASPEGVRVRLEDSWIERAGDALGSPGDVGSLAVDATGPQSVAIYFWGANMTKALHIGHLRDLAIGNALCAALTAAGAQVERRSLIADMGRGMGEAIAGVAHSGVSRPDLADLPQKGDHFVGRCYAEYVRSRSSAEIEDGVDSVNREATMHEDGADEVVERLLAGDEQTLELWRAVRELVLRGHLATLDRLGLGFSSVIFESSLLEQIGTLSELGLAAELLSYREDGATVYLTGREEFEEMPLMRPDGLPTQHMRALAYWAAAPDLDGRTSIQVCGSEWVAHVTCRQKLIDELARHSPEVNRMHPTHTLFHGMVTTNGQRLASSQGAPLLDDLIDWIDDRVGRDPVSRARRSALEPAGDLAARIALGYFLLHPVGKTVELDLESFFSDAHSLGWSLAGARAHAGSGTGATDGWVRDPEYRLLVLRSELLRHQLGLAVRRLDVAPIARHASHLAHWWTERERPAHLSQAMLAILDQIEGYLGLDVR
jgi:arginyl-tRNA synthetase